MEDRAGLEVAVVTSHRQGVDDQAGAHIRGHRPADHHSRRQVNHDRQIQPS